MSGRIRWGAALLLLACAWSAGPQAGLRQAPAAACPRCQWRPPDTPTLVSVRGVGQLYAAVERARPGTTILLEDGDYRLSRMLDIAAPRVVIRGKSGDPAKVTVRGRDMADRAVGVAFSISAPEVTIADLTIRDVGYHGVQVRGERAASRVMIHNVRIVDTGQQLVKGSTAGGPLYADEGTLACSTLEYTDHAPSDYTHGIDVLGGSGWTVRDNTFRRIRGPGDGRSGPAILFWANSQLTRVERNIIIDSFRGIAFGLGPGASRDSARDGEARYDHQGGWIRNNVVVNLHGWADEGIEANAARDVEIDHNTVFVEGRLPWSISIRFAETSGYARNNLTTRGARLRDGGRAELLGNVAGAKADWFVSLAAPDLRLAGSSVEAVDAGVPVRDVLRDMAGRSRASGRAPDAGAYEYAQDVP